MYRFDFYGLIEKYKARSITISVITAIVHISPTILPNYIQIYHDIPINYALLRGIVPE